MAEPTASASSPTWEKIRPTLQQLVRPFPYAAVAEAQASREEITPHLLEVITQLTSDPTPAIGTDDMLHLYAICLLAEFRERRAYRPLIALATQTDEIAEDLFGDFITANLGRAIASVCDGDIQPIKDLAENDSVSVWVRGAAIDALALRFLESETDARDVPQYLEKLGNREAARLREHSADQFDTMFMSLIVLSCAAIGAGVAMDSIRAWYADFLVDETMITLEEVEDAAQKTFAECREGLMGREHGYVRSAIGEMDHWVCFNPNENEDDDDDLDYLDDDFQIPYVRPEPKIGRNEPCPCRSEKKYKKCCGAA